LRRAVASIISLLPRGIFDQTTTKVTGEAFDAACKALPDTGQPAVVQDVMARRAIEAARKGERDPDRLRDAAIAAVKRTIRKYD
jgi:hypothetical protein